MPVDPDRWCKPVGPREHYLTRKATLADHRAISKLQPGVALEDCDSTSHMVSNSKAVISQDLYVKFFSF